MDLIVVRSLKLSEQTIAALVLKAEHVINNSKADSFDDQRALLAQHGLNTHHAMERLPIERVVISGPFNSDWCTIQDFVSEAKILRGVFVICDKGQWYIAYLPN